MDNMRSQMGVPVEVLVTGLPGTVRLDSVRLEWCDAQTVLDRRVRYLDLHVECGV